MDIREITPQYLVSGHVDPRLLPQLAEAGVTTLICNRPDQEVPPHLQADAMAQAAQAAGLAFFINPITHDAMTAEKIAAQRDAFANSDGITLAYCASGTRSTVIWAMAEASGGADVDLLIARAREGGYELSGLRDTLEALRP